jgi:hypothetical protein
LNKKSSLAYSFAYSTCSFYSTQLVFMAYTAKNADWQILRGIDSDQLANKFSRTTLLQNVSLCILLLFLI